ncbi:MAG: EthD domain-containing protein [Bacteroidetes bacterium]|nr:EthD domain-containing protein [Bacteroidota bacterium]
MQKLMIIFRGQAKESYSGFTDFMLRIAGKANEMCHPPQLHITFTDATPPVISIIPFRKSKIGVLSVYYEGGFPGEELLSFLAYCASDAINPSGRLAGAWSVEEALPVQYQKTWPDFEITPGVCLLTLFRRKTGTSHEAFLDRWHNSHTPLSLKIHPLWHYSRNVVLDSVTGSSEHWEGIVEEHFRRRMHLLNPFSFFGNPVTIIPHMIEVYNDTNAFLDFKTIETYLVREVVFRS